ncbi:hypothetical protein Pd630_LPD03738 [Rhodococcus opacus PD630]|nr:hypothetical protein Pd630_LPD03738 [Rhodococcus opacus PD630]
MWRPKGTEMSDCLVPELSVVLWFPCRLLVFDLPDQLMLRCAESLNQVGIGGGRH